MKPKINIFNFIIIVIYSFACFLLKIDLAIAEQENPTNKYGRQLPNDTEQKASYCLAVIKSTRNEILSATNSLALSAKNETNTSTKKILDDSIYSAEQTLDELRDQINRLQLFLLPRMSYLEPLAMLSAYSRGEADSRRQQTSSTVKNCITTCQNKLQEINPKCMDECMRKDELYSRIFQCRNLSFLPY